MAHRFLEPEQVDRLRQAIDPDAWSREVVLSYESGHFWRRSRGHVQSDRFGEVAFAVERPDGRFLTITCREYPTGIYRIPTGGISYGEDVVEAVHREVREELGLVVDIARFIGVLRMKLVHGRESFPFYSFLFHVREKSGNLLVDATENEVSAVREEDAQGLSETASRLLAIRRDWRDWGRFRHLTTDTVARYVRMLRRS